MVLHPLKMGELGMISRFQIGWWSTNGFIPVGIFSLHRFGSLKQPISLESAPRAETDIITVPTGPSKPWLPPSKRLHNCGKSSFLVGKLTISMAIFKSYVSHNQRVQLGELAKSCTSHFSLATRWSHKFKISPDGNRHVRLSDSE